MRSIWSQTLTIATILFAAQDATARCRAPSITAWPEGQIAADGMLVVEVPPSLAEALTTLRSGPLHFSDGKQKIRLRLEQELEAKGGHGVHQLVFVPERPLPVGAKVRLQVPTGSEHLKTLTTSRRSVVASERSEMGRTLGITINQSSYAELGCGPSALVQAHVAGSQSGMFLVEIERGANLQRLYIEAKDANIELGHGMCSGGFELAPGESHKLHLISVDATGKPTADTAEDVVFEMPRGG